MKKMFFTLFTLGAMFAFTACGSDNKEEEVIDYTLYDKSEIIGNQTGRVEAKLSIGNFTPFTGSSATNFIASNSSTLNLFITTPVEIGGPIATSDFKKSVDGKEYTFAVADYSPAAKVGNEIPAYITNWYKDYTISKVIIKDLKCSGAKYDKATKFISFSYVGAIEIYSKSGDNDQKVADNTITYKFTELLK